MNAVADRPLRQTAANMATVLRSVLAPVLDDKLEHRSVAELVDALSLACAGMAMSQYQPQWLRNLHRACDQLQKPLKKVQRAQQLHAVLNIGQMPPELRDEGAKVKSEALKRKEGSAREWREWIASEEGLYCRKTIEKSLHQGQKSKAFVLANTQIDEYLAGAEMRQEKCSRRLRKRNRWRDIKALGKAAQRQRVSLKFLNLLGLQLNADQHFDQIERYRELATRRRAARWMKRRLNAQGGSLQFASACGALWSQQFREAQKYELELLLGAGAVPSYSPALAKSERPELPLRLQFGSHRAA